MAEDKKLAEAAADNKQAEAVVDNRLVVAADSKWAEVPCTC